MTQVPQHVFQYGPPGAGMFSLPSRALCLVLRLVQFLGIGFASGFAGTALLHGAYRASHKKASLVDLACRLNYLNSAGCQPCTPMTYLDSAVVVLGSQQQRFAVFVAG